MAELHHQQKQCIYEMFFFFVQKKMAAENCNPKYNLMFIIFFFLHSRLNLFFSIFRFSVSLFWCSVLWCKRANKKIWKKGYCGQYASALRFMALHRWHNEHGTDFRRHQWWSPWTETNSCGIRVFPVWLCVRTSTSTTANWLRTWSTNIYFSSCDQTTAYFSAKWKWLDIFDSSSRPEIFETDEDVEDFTDFIEKLSNATFENFEGLPMNRTFGIASKDYLDLLWNLSITFQPEINSGTTHKIFLQDTITELGICYAINSKVAVYNSYRCNFTSSNRKMQNELFFARFFCVDFFFSSLISAIGNRIDGITCDQMIRQRCIHWMVKFMHKFWIYRARMRCLFTVHPKYQISHGNAIHFRQPIIQPLTCLHWKLLHQTMLKSESA